MAQTYTLDEAAEKLNLSVEEFKRRLRSEWTQVRSFRDGSTLRFRANEVDELARSIGLGSSEELPLAEGSELDLPAEIGLADDKAKSPAPKKKGHDSDAPLKLDDSDEMFLITPEPPAKGASSKKLKSSSDSDVRLEKASKKAAASDDEESILTEELEVPAQGGSGKLSGKSGRLSSAKLKSESGKLKSGDSGKAKTGDSGKQKAAAKADDSSSEFELSLEADSDEFELSLAPDSSEEVALGDAPPETGNKAGRSGINLNRPADSGVSLEKRKPAAAADDDEIDFELSLETPGSGSSRKKLGSGKKLEADSDSEFELTLEEPSDLAKEGSAEKKGDIFEATDFEIPALEDDSASEAVSLDEADTDLESSDFDLALDEDDAVADEESASEVVELDEEEVSAAKSKLKGKKKKKPADDEEDEGEIDLGDVDLEEGASASAALRGVRDDDEEGAEPSEEYVDAKGRPVVAAKWGPFPAILMFPTVVVMFLGGLMAYETLHSMWGYQQSNRPTTPLVSWFAEKLDMKPAQ